MVVNLATEVMEKILSLGKVCRLFVEVQCCLFMLQFFFFAIALKYSSLSRIISSLDSNMIQSTSVVIRTMKKLGEANENCL